MVDFTSSAELPPFSLSPSISLVLSAPPLWRHSFDQSLLASWLVHLQSVTHHLLFARFFCQLCGTDCVWQHFSGPLVVFPVYF